MEVFNSTLGLMDKVLDFEADDCGFKSHWLLECFIVGINSMCAGPELSSSALQMPAASPGLGWALGRANPPPAGGGEGEGEGQSK